MNAKTTRTFAQAAGFVVALSCAFTASASGTINYTDATDMPIGINAYSEAVADFMGNGKPDIVTCDGTLWLNESAGDGSISFVQGPAVPNTLWVAAADMDGDGKPDLIEIAEDGQIAVYLNTTQPGDTVPSFAAPVYFSAGNGITMVVAADINGDGKPDLVATDTGVGGVDVMVNTSTAGNLSFANFVYLPGDPVITSVAVGDLNDDGLADIVAVNEYDSTISVYINTTPVVGSQNVSFTAEQVLSVGNMPTLPVIADMNGDGMGDIVVANNNLNDISVLINTMTGAGSSTAAFAPEQDFATGNVPNWVAVTDVDGDGKPDLIAANSNDGTVSVMLNMTATGLQTASFAAQQVFTVGSDPENIVAADLNGDGKLDLAVLNTAGGGGAPTVSALINGN